MTFLAAVAAFAINVQAVLGFPVLAIDPVHLDDHIATVEYAVFGADRWYRTVMVIPGQLGPVVCISQPYHPTPAVVPRPELTIREVNQRSVHWRFSATTQVLETWPIPIPLAWASCAALPPPIS